MLSLQLPITAKLQMMVIQKHNIVSVNYIKQDEELHIIIRRLQHFITKQQPKATN